MTNEDVKLLRAIVEAGHRLERKWPSRACEGDLANLIKLIKRAADSPTESLSRLAFHARDLHDEMTSKHLSTILVPFERLQARAVRDDEFLVTSEDSGERIVSPIVVIADNIRSAFNVGAILRTSEALGAERVVLTGYTPTPDDEKTARTSMGTQDVVEWTHRSNVRDALQELRTEGYEIVVLETADGAAELGSFVWPERAALLLGNERFGVDHDLLAEADHVVRIPLQGRKNSLNVGIACGIALADWQRSRAAHGATETATLGETAAEPERPRSTPSETAAKPERPRSTPSETAAKPERPRSTPSETAAKPERPRSTPSETAAKPERPRSTPSETVAESATTTSSHATPAPAAPTPIAIFHSTALHPYEARRQASEDQSGEIATITLQPQYRQALTGLEGFDRIWLIYNFHHNRNWKPMVMPPRGPRIKQGVFATRSPYRPNALGLSAVELVKVDGLTLHVRKADLLDGTPIYDIKPYLPYADAYPDSRAGWTEGLAQQKYEVATAPRAETQLQWLEQNGVTQLRHFLKAQLEFDPLDDERKRITDQTILSYRTWRARFTIENQTVTIHEIQSGYTAAELDNAEDKYADKAIHRAFKGV